MTLFFGKLRKVLGKLRKVLGKFRKVLGKFRKLGRTLGIFGKEARWTAQTSHNSLESKLVDHTPSS